jgi:surface protein
MTSIFLNSIIGLTYPYDVYVCDVYGNNCGYVVQINVSVPSPVEVVLPPQFNMSPAVGIKIITSDGCERFKIIDCNVLLPPFISTWNTNNTSGGSSANNQIQLPLNAGGSYYFTVDWGDGSEDTITSYNQTETLHTYAAAGTYTLEITGVIDEWCFSFAVLNDNKKILSISNWGNLRFGIVDVYNFLGCSNLTLTSVIGILDLSLTIYFDNTFGNCSSITTINGINNWDTSTVQTMSGLFAGCTNFNSDISNWNVSNVTNMGNMFLNAIAFNQNISTWDISNVTDLSIFMSGKSDSNYSSSYLDTIYNTWSTLTVQPNLTVDFGTIKYTASGQAGKNILTGATNNWVINDGGI